MEFLLVGLNHRTSPLEVREQLSLTKAQLPQALQAMADYGVPGVILCTCNRSEFYAMEPGDGTASPIGRQSSEERIKQFLADRFNVSPPASTSSCTYIGAGSASTTSSASHPAWTR